MTLQTKRNGIRQVTKEYFIKNALEVVKASRDEPIEVIDENGKRIAGMSRVTLEEDPTASQGSKGE